MPGVVGSPSHGARGSFRVPVPCLSALQSIQLVTPGIESVQPSDYVLNL